MKRKMSEKRCRLCFETKTKSIAVFKGKGAQLNIALVIRMHLPDEAREDDELPKWICRECWRRLADFHEFYNAVEETKAAYLITITKDDTPKFVEINCDSFECEDDSSVPKEKPDEIVIKVEMESIIKDSSDDDKSLVQQDDIDDDGENVANLEDKSSLDAVARRPADEATPKTESTISPSKGYEGTEGEQKHLESLVPNFMDMVCDTCQYPFESLAAANAHYRHEHRQRGIVVKCCQKRVDLYDVFEHIQYHLNPDIFKCDKCDKKFMLSRVLRNHLRSHLPKTFECDVCKKKFPTRSIIKTHILVVHGGEKQKRKCEICNKIFVTKYSLNSHVKLVHQRHYQKVCHICAKVYSTSNSFRQHMKEHNEVKDPRAECELCGRTYKTAKGLRCHMAIHREENQTFKCPHCPKISPNRHALNGHIRVMHNYKLHKCHFCDRECKSTMALTEHLATHTGEYLYDCVYCPKKFKSHSNMYQHYKDSHPIEWSADRKTKPRAFKRKHEAEIAF